MNKYTVCYTDDTKKVVNTHQEDLGELIERIRSDESLATATQNFRASSNEKEKLTLKQNLPAFIPSISKVKGNRRNLEHCEEHSGLLCLDFDKLEDAAAFKKEAIEEWSPLAAFISPSGKGVKVIIKTDLTLDDHKPRVESWLRVLNEFDSNIDVSCSDPTRLCFLSSDADAFYDSECSVYRVPEADGNYSEAKDPQITSIEEAKAYLQAARERNPALFTVIRVLARNGFKRADLSSLIAFYKAEIKPESDAKINKLLDRVYAGVEKWKQENDFKETVQAPASGTFGHFERIVSRLMRKLNNGKSAVEQSKGYTWYWCDEKSGYWVEKEDKIINLAREAATEYVANNPDPEKRENLANSWLNISKYKAYADSAEIEKFKSQNHQNPEFDTIEHLFGLNGNVLDLKEGSVRTPKPSDMISKHTDYSVTVGKFPVTESYISGICEGDNERIEYLKSFMAQCLVGSNEPDDRFLFLQGVPGGGKTTFINFMRELVGDYGAVINADNLIKGKGNNFWLANLKGKRLAVANEVGNGRWEEADISMLSDGSVVTGDVKYKKEQTFKLQTSLIVTSNHLPRFNANSGLSRRIVLIEIDNTPKEIDTQIGNKLKAEIPTFIYELLKYSKANYERGGLPPVPSVWAKASAEYTESEDYLERFLNTRVGEAKTDVPVDQMYQVFRQWAADNREAAIGKRALNKQLRRKGLKDARINVAGSNNKSKLHVWKNVQVFENDVFGNEFMLSADHDPKGEILHFNK